MAVLVCDTAATDPTTGKKSLLGIFDVVNVGRFPTQRPVTLYIKVTDAEGLYKVRMPYVQVGTGEVLGQAEGELIVDDRLTAADVLVPFPPLPIPSAGRYEFQVWANSMFLGSTSIRAKRRRV